MVRFILTCSDRNTEAHKSPRQRRIARIGLYEKVTDALKFLCIVGYVTIDLAVGMRAAPNSLLILGGILSPCSGFTGYLLSLMIGFEAIKVPLDRELAIRVFLCLVPCLLP